MSKILQFIINFSAKGGNAVAAQAAALQSRLDAADSSATRLASSIGGRLKSAFMSLPGAEFITNPIVAMTAGIGTVAKLGMEADMAATSFGVLVGSEEKSASMLEKLNKYADGTIWGRKEILEASKTMLGYSVSADTVVSDLQRLGDIAMGDKQRLQSLALVFGQVASAGKLQGQDLLQLINAGYNPLQDIAELTGKTMSEVRDEMSKGNISYEMFRQAVIKATSAGGRFNGMTDKLAETSGGALQQMLGVASKVLLEIYKIIEPLLIPTFNTLSAIMENVLIPVVQGIAAAFNWLFNLFKEGNPWVIGIASGIGVLTAAIILNTSVLKGWKVAELAVYGAMLLVEKGQRLINLAMKANPIGFVIAIIAALLTALVACWKKFAGFRAVILTVWDTIKGFGLLIKNIVVGNIMSLLNAIGKVGEAIGKLFRGDFDGAWQSVKDAGKAFIDKEGKAKNIQQAKELFGGISGNYQSRLEKEREKQAAKDAIEEPEAAAGVADDFIGPVLDSSAASTSPGKIANDITTGGTRNTQITLNIGKFFDNINVTNEHGVGMNELQRIILESINRSLEIATSAAR